MRLKKQSRPHGDLIEAVVERQGLSLDAARKRIEEMSLRERLDDFLNWNGILGYTDDIMGIINDALQDEADKIAHDG